MKKVSSNLFQLTSEEDVEALRGVKIGSTVKAAITQPINEKFRRKWWVLVTYAFDIWKETVDEQREYKGSKVLANFDRFRQDITILSGFFDSYYNALGEVRVKAKSLQWHRMNEENFTKLYSKTIDVILQKVIPKSGITDAQMREYVDTVIGFD